MAKCTICNRKLKNSGSILNGMGPVCLARHGNTEQLSIFDLEVEKLALIEIKNTVTHKKVIDALFESDSRLHDEIIEYFNQKFGLEKKS